MSRRRSQQEDDEAYAKALQDEYRKEFIRRQQAQAQAQHATDTRSGGASSSATADNSRGGADTGGDNTLADKPPPKKYVKIEGTMRMNPAYKVWKKNRDNSKKKKKSSSSSSSSRSISRRGSNGSDDDEIDTTSRSTKNRRSSTGGSSRSSSRKNINNSNNSRRSSSGNGSRSSTGDDWLSTHQLGNTVTINVDDEEYARQIQNQLESVERSPRRSSRSQSSQRHHLSPPPSSTGDDWVSTTHHHQHSDTDLNTQLGNTVVPIPPPYDVASSSSSNNDEEYARQIQNQFEQEEMEQSRRDEEYARTIATSGTPRRKSSKSSSRSLSRSSPRSSSSARILNHQSNSKFPHEDDMNNNATSADYNISDVDRYSNASGSTAPSTDIDVSAANSDEEVARRIQQDMDDADFAQRMSLREQQEIASRTTVQSLERQQELALNELQQGPPKSCVRKFLPLGFCVIISITIPLLFVFNVFDTRRFFGDLFGDGFIGSDPWSGKVNNTTIIEINGTSVPQVPTNAYRWPIRNNDNVNEGLRLDILNACSDDGDYSNFVEQAIANWDNGSPIDSLTLFSTKIRYEKDCQTVTGKLKICNGDYGDTRWRGLNEVLLSPRKNTIVASTAKLNEYYLNYENDYQKLYTACHELGHGFGLPHWDENFFNKDLGNCMDYTSNPEDSYMPDESNFLYLAQLYGGREVIPGSANSIIGLLPADRQRRRTTSLLRNRFSRGLSTSTSSSTSSSLQEQHQRGIPLSHSRLLNEDGILPGVDDINIGNNDSKQRRKRTRILLQATEQNEIHMYDSDEYPGHTVIQRFSLV